MRPQLASIRIPTRHYNEVMPKLSYFSSKYQAQRGVTRGLHTSKSHQFPLHREVSFTSAPTVAFVGLGAMGYQMAKRLAIVPHDGDKGDGQLAGVVLHRGSEMHRGMESTVLRNVLVWNRNPVEAKRHASEFHTVDIGRTFEALGNASIVFMCLPTSEITFDRVKEMAPHLASDVKIVDCCTGHPSVTKDISNWLQNELPDAHYLDCPISGGPGGASKGTVAAFLGGDSKAAESVLPHIEAFAGSVTYLGPVGSGHAVKAVNNACNVTNLLCMHEGLLALRKMGVDPAKALEVINKSSGRSLMSEQRIPQEVLTGDFNYGFKLGLMAKDVGIAADLMDEYFPAAEVYRRTLKTHYDAMAAGTVSFDSDYTEIVKHQENKAGVTLQDPVADHRRE